MTKSKPRLFVHEDTGDIVTATKSQEKRLPSEYKRAEFTKNEEGVPVLRVKLRHATVDISDNGEQEVTLDGNGSPE